MRQDQPKAARAVKPSLVSHEAQAPVDAPKILAVAAGSGPGRPRRLGLFAWGGTAVVAVVVGTYALVTQGAGEPVLARRAAASDAAGTHVEKVAQQEPAVVDGRQAPTKESQAATIVTESPDAAARVSPIVSATASSAPPATIQAHAKPAPAPHPVRVTKHKAQAHGPADKPASPERRPDADVRLLTAIVAHIKDTGAGDAAVNGPAAAHRLSASASAGR